MAYNNGKAKSDWEIWKNNEEKIMRDLGVDEEVIRQIREYDWDIFKSERRFYEKLPDEEISLDFIAEREKEREVNTAQDLLDYIDNPQLHKLLVQMDKLTLDIIVFKMNGYSSQEISEICGLSVQAINFRMWHFRKKFKNF